MLPFGSITSIIPLILLAFAYVIYFSLCIMARHNNTEPGGLLPEGKREICVESISRDTGSYPDFRSALTDLSDDAITVEPGHLFSYVRVSCVRGMTSPAMVDGHHLSCSFPRPPPAGSAHQNS